MTTQSQVNVSKLYQSVIEDVMTGIRESFLDEGVDEQVLSELRMLWESKLVSSKTYEPINSSESTMSSAASASNSNNGTPASQKNASSASNSQTQHPQQTVLPTDPNAPVSIQIAMPRQISDPSGVQKTITIQVPASCIHTNKLQDILTLPTVQATLSLPAELAASTLQAQVNQALQSSGLIDTGMIQIGNHTSVITSPHQMQSNVMSNIVQLDGQAAGGDSSEDEDEEDDDDDDLDEDGDDKDDEREDEQEDEGQDEEPLNSGDDVSDAEDSNDKLYEIDNVVVCQYDKITRTRNKWKFHLKDGIMNLNGKDYVFQKANGDAEW